MLKKNKRYRNQQKYDMSLMKLIARDELRHLMIRNKLQKSSSFQLA
jgi:hypothetical protein